jgi:hypothetical protein
VFFSAGAVVAAGLSVAAAFSSARAEVVNLNMATALSSASTVVEVVDGFMTDSLKVR